MFNTVVVVKTFEVEEQGVGRRCFSSTEALMRLVSTHKNGSEEGTILSQENVA